MSDPGRPKRRWFQYSLRTLFVVMLLACIGLSWFAVKMQQARKQRAAVAAIGGFGGRVFYDYDPSGAGQPDDDVFVRLLGNDFFGNVVEVHFNGPGVTDAAILYVRELPHLRTLNLVGTAITDAGLGNLGPMPQLQELCLWDANITDLGMQHVARFTQLRELIVRGTRVTDAGLRALTQLTQLETLDLTNIVAMKVCDNGFTDIALKHLAGAVRL